MYQKLPLEILVPNPRNANRISRMFAKKLRHNIEQIGMYETLTVRSHPRMKGKFDVLNGHARLEVLRKLNAPDAKCDLWEVTESQARLFLAILNRLRGSDVAELRMNLLFDLLREHSKEELATHIPDPFKAGKASRRGRRRSKGTAGETRCDYRELLSHFRAA